MAWGRHVRGCRGPELLWGRKADCAPVAIFRSGGVVDNTAGSTLGSMQFALLNYVCHVIATFSLHQGVYVSHAPPVITCVLRCVVGAGWRGRPLLPLVPGRQAVRRTCTPSGRQRSELCALRRVRCAPRRAGCAVGDGAGAAAAGPYGNGDGRRAGGADAGCGGCGEQQRQGRARERG